ncbi:radial spoke head protein 6 homolog A isoform X1 [Salmo salar]|uniref:Radial spoke head protein 6 homolog A isoform X1 n=1 Tax=Salmo salar TaxID=8030 RepID=A0ABM3CHK6_SALSA|nr:radial spoke head protein 6 homolog A isoform X1 [Salmo salar]|eukprot:XP_013984426.1 PREDICTED: radial spoke head protein 6 homolog A-like isoform X1 [Salmo salar]
MESEGAPLNDQREQTSICFKAFMLKNSTTSNLNLYDHLARVLTKVMDERPENVVDVIEDMSHEVKRGLLLDKQSTLRDIPLSPAAHLLAEQQMLLFSWGGGDDGDQEVETPLPNVSEVGFLLEQAGVGLGREEMLRVFLALKKLVNSQPLARCRLWGKILGTEGNYLVAEGEYRDGEEEGINEETAEDAEGEPRDDAEVVEVIDTLPRSTFKPPPVVPTEDNRTGVNKFTYFVCREPGLPWMRLPTVTPTQITAARHIRKFFTGRLDAPIVSYPPFPGNEANYLRAQIARISAGTQVSPLGFYQFGEEEGEEVEEGARDSFEENPDFEGIPVPEMAESLSTWVHHVQHILQQGRCVWVNLAEKPEDDFEEEADEEVKEADEPEPEVGPPLLTPLSEDAEITTTPPWSSKMSSTLISQFAIAVLRSNLWPGAYAYASGKKFENIYFGWGLKFAGEAYTPTFPTMPQREYTSGPEITEALDPSLEEEQALKAALEEQKTAQDETEGLGGDEEDDD